MAEEKKDSNEPCSPSGEQGATGAGATLIYCYDAYCSWCYGFSPVMKKIAAVYRNRLDMEVLSGGMIFEEKPRHIGAIAGYMQDACKTVESTTGIRFGNDFLWHVVNPDESDWHPDSTKPAVALCIFKDYQPARAIEAAADLQHALNYEGRDLTDDEAYRHLLAGYGIPENEFYAKLRSEEYREKAYYEFALVKQLQVTGYPTVLLQVSDSKFYLLARGYTDYDTLSGRMEKVLDELVKSCL